MTDWSDIPGYVGAYQVSPSGRVRSLDRFDASGNRRSGKEMSVFPDTHGYPVVRLTTNGNGKALKVHRLMLMAFVGPCPEGMEGCHNDGNPSNCQLDNLRWDYPKANWQDSVKHGRRKAGPDNPHAKWNAVDAERISDLLASGASTNEVSAWLGISKGSVYNASKKLGRYSAMNHSVVH